MKRCWTISILLGIACCVFSRGTVSDEEENERQNQTEILMSALRPRGFTPGTLIGLVVASMVVVIGSFLVFWRICCDVEMVLTEGPAGDLASLNSVSAIVPQRPLITRSKSTSPELSGELLMVYTEPT